MDLSLYSQVNVYTLGKTYLKLSQELHINVPAIGEDIQQYFLLTFPVAPNEEVCMMCLDSNPSWSAY